MENLLGVERASSAISSARPFPEPRQQAPRPPLGLGLPEFHGGLLDLCACAVPFMLQDNNPSAQRVVSSLGLIGADSEPVDLRSQPVAFGLQSTDLAGMGLAEAVDHGLGLSVRLSGVHALLGVASCVCNASIRSHSASARLRSASHPGFAWALLASGRLRVGPAPQPS